jgi:hypothetical protein
MRIFQAIAVFFKVLFQARFAAKVRDLDEISRKAEALQVTLEKDSARHKLEIEQLRSAPKEEHGNFEEGAYALLSLMQKEARFLDFVQENLQEIPDAQVGAVSKRIHKDLTKLFKQFLKVEPVFDSAENQKVSIEEGFEPAEIQLSGNVEKKPPLEGILRHKGWMVDSLNLPRRTSAARTKVLQPAQVEVA